MKAANINAPEECWCICLRMIMSILSKIPLEKILPDMTSVHFQSSMKNDSWGNQEFIFELEDRLQIGFDITSVLSFPEFFYPGINQVKTVGEWVHEVIYSWLPTTVHKDLRW